MAKAVQKIKLSPSRDIPFNKLVLSQSNVRRTKAGISIEDLAEDIARRSLLQSLNVRPISDAEGQESGRFVMIEDGLGFRLVPWQPILEKRIGQFIAGIQRESGGIEWDFGRKRGLGI